MRKNKRIIPLLLLLLTAALAGACSAPQSATVSPAESEETAATTETEAPETQTEPEPEEPTVLEPSDVRIGMVFYGEEGDGSVLAEAQREGLRTAAAGLGIGEEQILWQYNSREADWTQIEDSILACVDAGCQIVFGGSREYSAVIAAIAEEYPEVMFACVGSDLYNGTNSGTYSISLAAAQYMSGVAAAAVSETGHIGFLAAKNASDSEVTDSVNAFAYGVWSVNPQAVVEVGVTGKWFLPEAERQAVADLQGFGCDVLGAYTDCAIGIQTAAAAGMRVAGCGFGDAAFYGNGYESQSIGAVTYRFELYFTMKLNQVIGKEVVGEAWSGDYYSGAAEFSGTAEILQEALLQLASWRPVEEGENPTEAAESKEDVSGTEETSQTEAPETVPSEAESLPETEAAASEPESLPETEATVSEPDGSDTEAENSEPAEESDEAQTEPEEVIVISRDRETGYLTNVRIHEIEVAQEPEE